MNAQIKPMSRYEEICDEQDAARTAIRQAVTDMKNAGIKEGIYKAAEWIRFASIVKYRSTPEARALCKALADELEKGI